ncbi:hypothetical protein CC85DRAFT_282025 [Cutaneotrichosporon oleaginosum]|uniref:GATA-type domain-containing protein n=1 Tax=Cutaneotrichosporon oleaginosum TaxID=879819 RepID=A0A0J0XXU8_9TREE|nr:uncharacterized protein CC85DRAFT_282025 [Cutaneotrichosporon oleaginosum]KLT45878.1 hypothetical protein CC85DRAFT_282025 [Cutaneotrichosporon oleaginosum]TXT06579.1 hypothetical protein COLE_05910 [Cutaneotrichosporon oleaginosum]
MEPTLDSALQIDSSLHNAAFETPEAPEAHPPPAPVEQVIPPVTPEHPSRSKKTADPVRREANRRAAERSRGRQQEKIVALEMAVQTLSDENLRLKDEIARIEGRDAAPEVLASIEQQANAVPAESSQSLDAAAAAAVASQVQNQRFLELLAQGGDIPWAQLLSDSEAEVDGRLGQLAAVASNQAGDEQPQHTPAPSTGPLPSAKVRPGPLLSAALTAELEKSLQEEISSVKSAIARADRELARRQGQPVLGDIHEDAYHPTFTDLYEADEVALAEYSAKAEVETAELETQARVLREVTTRMRAAMEEEESKLLPLEEELRALNVDGQRDREGVTAVLRALRGHITSLMSAPGGLMPGNLLVTPFSSPATARRRRGRPPKHTSTASSSKYSFSYQHSPTSSDSGTELPDTPGTRPARAAAPRRSRLAQELRFEPEQHQSQPHSAEAGPSQALPGSVEANVVAETSQATQDYLLSHFAAGDVSRDTPIPLDSSSFAALLPQSPSTHAHHATLESSLSAPTSHMPNETSNGHPETPNVMSRFKRGPPGSCDICSRTQTSVWRKLTYDGEELRVCNACGLYHSKFHIPRPPELWGDGRTIKKRKAGPRNWEGVKRRREQQRKTQYDEVGADIGMDVDHRVLEDSTAVHAVGVAGSATPDPALQQGLTTLQEVGQAVENMYAVQQQEAAEQQQQQESHQQEPLQHQLEA